MNRLIPENLAVLPFWSALTDRARLLLADQSRIVSYAAGTLIHADGMPFSGIILLLSGSVHVCLLTVENRPVLLYRLLAGSCDVISPASVVHRIGGPVHMTAHTPVELLVIPAAALSDIQEHYLVIRGFIMETLSEHLAEASQRLASPLLTHLDRRLAAALLSLADSVPASGADGSRTVPVMHEELAAQLGSSREVISRLLKKMEAAQLVKLGRGRIVIPDRARLSQFVEA